MKDKVKILGDTWFSGRDLIGIVVMNNGFGDKAYIGTVNGINKKEDMEYILTYGVPFPIEQAKQLCGI